ncbi:hypothetical protein IMZ08_17740 [Bacillus luteolus]|uniref:Lipoprotein n=1 Tax=Litchfieldia luteola TaxID=682179 RepID=A0ABR9QN02_9BACI|nr:hypothetical protein [Cytobacillus luteolus]MBE4909881.1 hypothetical protein [Cytobacillus luteolus]MBP1942569.1 uncharacterized protein YceK [Cytobacillus luteolus]
MRKLVLVFIVLLSISGCSEKGKLISKLEEIDVINLSTFKISSQAATFESNNATIYDDIPTTVRPKPRVLLYGEETDSKHEYDLHIQIYEEFDEVILISDYGTATISVDWDAYSREKKKLLQNEDFVKQTSVIQAIYDMLHKQQEKH